MRADTTWAAEQALPVASVRDARDAWVGSFQYAGGQSERKALDDAIEDIVQEMNFLIRPIARSRLKEANVVPGSIGFAKRGVELEIEMAGKRPLSAPVDGTAVFRTNSHGERIKVVQRVSQPKLHQHCSGSQGEREIHYVLDEDGKRLTAHITIRSERLPKPLQYRLTYRRVR